MREELKFVLTALFLVAVSVGIKANAQSKFSEVDVQQWPSGMVYLATGDSIQGAITYHCKEDIVNVLKDDGTVSSLTPVNVLYFVVRNTFTGMKQVFRTLDWDQGNVATDFKKPTFFELLNTGKLTLIMRETYAVRKANGLSNLGQSYRDVATPDGQYIDEVRPLYYILLPDGEIKTLKNIRRDTMRLFGDKAGQIRKYTKVNKLSFEQPNELTAIVNYYNTL